MNIIKYKKIKDSKYIVYIDDEKIEFIKNIVKFVNFHSDLHFFLCLSTLLSKLWYVLSAFSNSEIPS